MKLMLVKRSQISNTTLWSSAGFFSSVPVKLTEVEQLRFQVVTQNYIVSV